jgi:hypothetical protein
MGEPIDSWGERITLLMPYQVNATPSGRQGTVATTPVAGGGGVVYTVTVSFGLGKSPTA